MSVLDVFPEVSKALRQGKCSKVGPGPMANLSTPDTSSGSSNYTTVPAALSLRAMTV